MLKLFTDIESLINEMAEMTAMTQNDDQIIKYDDLDMDTLADNKTLNFITDSPLASTGILLALWKSLRINKFCSSDFPLEPDNLEPLGRSIIIDHANGLVVKNYAQLSRYLSENKEKFANVEPPRGVGLDHLLPPQEKREKSKSANKIKKILKTVFKLCEFKTRKYKSMYTEESITISWVDGPRKADVISVLESVDFEYRFNYEHKWSDEAITFAKSVYESNPVIGTADCLLSDIYICILERFNKFGFYYGERNLEDAPSADAIIKAEVTDTNTDTDTDTDTTATVDTGINDEEKDQCYKAFVFAHQFYPTPKKIADKMAAELKRDRDIKLVFPVLDPSAGKGNLLDAIAVYVDKYGSDRKNQLRGIEIDPDLAATLKGKEYLLVGNDFLTFNERECCPSIIMNPPFSSGLAHIFHAWEILKPGGRIVALLPETPRFTKNVRLAELIRLHGKSKSLGSCFEFAGRSTDCPIQMITLDKPKQSPQEFKFKFENENRSQTFTKEDFESAIAQPTTAGLGRSDIIVTLVHQYELALDALREKFVAQAKLDFALQGIGLRDWESTQSKAESSERDRHNSFEKEAKYLKARFWDEVFRRTELRDASTSDFIEKFDEFQKEQELMAFNEENIRSLLLMFWENKKQIDVDSVIKVFDGLTRYHAKNTIAYKGWKTNKASKLNYKVIIPYCKSSMNFVDYHAEKN
jgi:hypothetical protein